MAEIEHLLFPLMHFFVLNKQTHGSFIFKSDPQIEWLEVFLECDGIPETPNHKLDNTLISTNDTLTNQGHHALLCSRVSLSSSLLYLPQGHDFEGTSTGLPLAGLELPDETAMHLTIESLFLFLELPGFLLG